MKFLIQKNVVCCWSEKNDYDLFLAKKLSAMPNF